MDLLLLEILRTGLDDLVNEDNPLQHWLRCSPHKFHKSKQPVAGSSG